MEKIAIFHAEVPCLISVIGLAQACSNPDEGCTFWPYLVEGSKLVALRIIYHENKAVLQSKAQHAMETTIAGETQRLEEMAETMSKELRIGKESKSLLIV